MDLTHINILHVIGGNLKKVSQHNGGEYAGACPFCGGTDRFRVWDQPSDGSNPAFWCRQCDAKGDVIGFISQRDGVGFMGACEKLGLELESQGNGAAITPTQYAAKHGLDLEDLRKAGWCEAPCPYPDHKNRPALQFNTSGGKRWRFLDNEKPKYISESGFTRSWYGLSDKVMQTAKESNSPLFLCNGEISAIAARFYGVPAITIAGGAEKRIPDDLLRELLTKWDGRIGIVLDCDETGRKYAKEIKDQLDVRAEIINLDLAEGQDLADFVRLHQFNSTAKLKRLMPLPQHRPVSSRESAARTTLDLDVNSPVEGKPIILPYTIYHEFRGYALVGMPKKLTCAVAMSGHGKTSWLNTLIDQLCIRGENGVGVMPEFEGNEYQWDRIQRYSGRDGMPFIESDKMMLWDLWRWEHQSGVPYEKREGHELSTDEKRAVTHIDDMVESWAGQFELFPLTTNINDVFDEMGDAILARRGTPDEITYAAFDYIQILKAKNYPDDDNAYEYVMGLIKQFVMKYNIHGFVTSQVNKTADKQSREQNRVLTTTDMRYVRDDKVNLLITLNPIYDETTGEKVKVDGTDCYASVVNIAKNTKGKQGKVNQIWDAMHLTWLDQTYSKKSINLADFDDSNL